MRCDAVLTDGCQRLVSPHEPDDRGQEQQQRQQEHADREQSCKKPNATQS
jgi:hypothetical protein